MNVPFSFFSHYLPQLLFAVEDDEIACKADYDRISREHFERSYVAPPEMRFVQSDALFPPAELRAVLAAGFEAQCRMLCFGPYPSSDDVQARMEEIRLCCDSTRQGVRVLSSS
jgi:hypothetical protein